MDGSIPWSAAEYWALLREGERLHALPHDDWDRRPRGVVVPGGSRIGLMPDSLVAQMGLYLVERYRDLPYETSMSHVYRWLTIAEFLKMHRDRLRADEMIVQGAEPRDLRVSVDLIEVLAVARYNATFKDGTEDVTTFDYEEVVGAVRARWRGRTPL
jgi:hypothetical protein